MPVRVRLWSAPVGRVLAGLLLLASLPSCAAPPAECPLHVVTRMPLQVQDGLLTVRAALNGHWVRLVVDTGAERSVVSKELVKRLDLPPDQHPASQSQGVGGTMTTTDVAVGGLLLGGVRFPIDHVAVGGFDLRTDNGLQADGLLGADILLAFDMDIDVRGGTLTLYRVRQCPDPRPPWAEAVEIPGVQARRDRLLVPIELDGTAAMALLDTGAQRNVVGIALARRLGLTDQLLATDARIRQRGVGPRDVIAHLHRFGRLRVGPVTEPAPEIAVLPVDAGFGDVLIGEEFLQGRRVWLALHNRRMFVTPRSGEP